MAEDEERIDGSGGGRDEGMSEDEIDHNLMETFPASDPPSWTLGVDHSEETRGEEGDPGGRGRDD